MATSLEIRDTLVDALSLDLIGPSPGHALEGEVLEQHPSRWYLTGFLVPTGASLEQRSEAAGTEQPDLFDSGGGTDDAETADPPAARRNPNRCLRFSMESSHLPRPVPARKKRRWKCDRAGSSAHTSE